MSLLGLIKGNGPSGFGYTSTAEQVAAGIDLSGKTYLITGCNSGLGLETMRVIVEHGARVFALARSVEKATIAGDKVGGETIPVACELSDPRSVRSAVKTVKSLGFEIDGLICNAGIMSLPDLHVEHGLELQFLTNHIGHFILVQGLRESLSDEGRVVILSSDAHIWASNGIPFDNLDGAKGYNGWRNYGQSKLANLLCARELARQFEGSKQMAFAVHPGVIKTNLNRHMNSLISIGLTIGGPIAMKTVSQGAATQVYAAIHPDAARHNGEYLADCNVKRSSSKGRDMALAKNLWDESLKIVAAI